ncbi:hypothetical protein [Amycolatopsis eburnea]|uniref:Uncharacterized protein n=1 Tax=Amycolatopsis eburnea TaxID=2267691 RepID=A0A427TK12_9PSEU|nr:hypothetical protein [Amycolatopsis eburnea]RSD23952.1 hypothetical protein EIY87_06165 [Amycolatopsis eburnea]
MPADSVAEPYRVHDPTEVAQKLALGAWVVFRHEFQNDGCDLVSWLEAVRAACAGLDVVEEVITIFPKDLTVVINAEIVPTAEQVQASVSRVELDRWTERNLPPELPARAARGQ